MFGNSELYALLNTSSVTDLLDSRSKTDTAKALIADSVIPSAWTAVKVINYYMTSPVNLGDAVRGYIYTINCRAATQYQAGVIASAVAKALHRVSFSGGIIKCVLKASIPPADSTDTYNHPVEATVTIREE
jgi:hypothetical protein